MTGQLGINTRTGLLYIWDFNPDTERLQWLRYDTFVRGEWRKYPWRTATAANVQPLSNARAALLLRRR